jgi:hypothetical protein
MKKNSSVIVRKELTITRYYGDSTFGIYEFETLEELKRFIYDEIIRYSK